MNVLLHAITHDTITLDKDLSLSFNVLTAVTSVDDREEPSSNSSKFLATVYNSAVIIFICTHILHKLFHTVIKYNIWWGFFKFTYRIIQYRLIYIYTVYCNALITTMMSIGLMHFWNDEMKWMRDERLIYHRWYFTNPRPWIKHFWIVHSVYSFSVYYKRTRNDCWYLINIMILDYTVYILRAVASLWRFSSISPISKLVFVGFAWPSGVCIRLFRNTILLGQL